MNTIQPQEVPPGLFEQIMKRIAFAQQAQARRRFVGCAALFLTALVLCVPLWRGFWLDLSQSGFSQFFSLVFSDFRTVVTDWQDYGLSLLESFPFVSATEILGAVLLSLLALQAMAKYAKHLFISSSFQA